MNIRLKKRELEARLVKLRSERDALKAACHRLNAKMRHADKKLDFDWWQKELAAVREENDKLRRSLAARDPQQRRRLRIAGKVDAGRRVA